MLGREIREVRTSNFEIQENITRQPNRIACRLLLGGLEKGDTGRGRLSISRKGVTATTKSLESDAP